MPWTFLKRLETLSSVSDSTSTPNLSICFFAFFYKAIIYEIHNERIHYFLLISKELLTLN